MKTLKQYRTEKKNQPYPTMDTCYGTHSLPRNDNQPYPEMDTEFGSHSVQESSKLFMNTDARDNEIHRNIAPLNDDLLSNAEMGAVIDYTDGSTSLNKMLRDKSYTQPALVDSANNLSSALGKHKTGADIHVFTGVSRSPARFFNSPDQKDAIVHLPTFTSTTTNHKVADRFTKPRVYAGDTNHGIGENAEVKHIIRIHIPAGSHAASMKEHSAYPHEREVLMDRGYNIKIERTPVDVGNDTFMWHATVVGHNPQPLH